ncbi:HTH-type transcriptional activator Btr [Poriferisphaera corsica]|uniref:HTH-type transcriptional activator Btr n=1 Tax=Poriferisphaera corsica TaxID=2528020 RepID=A0A517YQD8_9BACT|nr:AraC family transcriptional regulator [Poriferisphaera corsica]QDU32443.1 HTH-type transcriptional activator Btr [Poriferisphaera corsica]
MNNPQTNLTPTLWHAQYAGLEAIPPGHPYWFENQDRTPTRSIVLQTSLQGSITYQDQQQTLIAPPNHLLIFVYGEPSAYGHPHLTHPSQTYQNLWLNLDGAGLIDHINLFRSRFSPVIDLSHNTAIIDHIQQIYRMVSPHKRTPPTTTASHIYKLINNLFVFSESRRNTTQSPVDRAVDQIINQPTYPWSLKTLAASVGCSREHLTRHFTQRIGIPPAQYLQNIRTERARQLLKHSNLSINEIAQTLGYTSMHTFARQIKSQTGLSPTNYRNQ